MLRQLLPGAANQPSIEIRTLKSSSYIYLEPDVPESFIKDAIFRFHMHLYHFSGRFQSLDDIDWIWCLVGNIVEEHEYRPDKQIVRGTKHFSGGSKVYCYPFYADRIRVIGRPRHTKQFKTLWMNPKYITNWRLKKVYEPEVVGQMLRDFAWDPLDESKEAILTYVNHYNPESKLESDL